MFSFNLRVSKVVRSILFLSCCSILFLSPGCGGGTTGTGGGIQISGALRSLQGAPISGVHVAANAVTPVKASIGATNKSALDSTAVTDARGAFTVSVDLQVDEVPSLRFQGAGINREYVVSSLPVGTKIVDLNLNYDEDNDEIREESVRYEDESGNEINE